MNSQLAYLKRLNGLSENEAFRQYMEGHRVAVEHLKGILVATDPTASIDIAKLQAQISAREAELSEYDNVKKMIFELENLNSSVIHKPTESNLVPPRK